MTSSATLRIAIIVATIAGCGNDRAPAAPSDMGESATDLTQQPDDMLCPAPGARCSGTCVNTSVDPKNCGACGIVCPAAANGTPACVARMCTIVCDPGFGDCDDKAGNGCEHDLAADNDNCGACGTSCEAQHGTFNCKKGACTLDACDPGWGDCNTIAVDGCETDIHSVSRCGLNCNTARQCDERREEYCSAGECVVQCSRDVFEGVCLPDGCRNNQCTQLRWQLEIIDPGPVVSVELYQAGSSRPYMMQAVPGPNFKLDWHAFTFTSFDAKGNNVSVVSYKSTPPCPSATHGGRVSVYESNMAHAFVPVGYGGSADCISPLP